MLRRIFIAPISPSIKISLGRWECTNMKLNQIKIDWANVDHCGTCSHTSLLSSSDSVIQHHSISVPTQESRNSSSVRSEK